MTLRRALPLAILLSLLACGFDRPLTPSDRVPVIQAALIVGADTQYFRLDWALDPDSGWDGLPRPIDPADVDLVVTGDSGSQPLVPALWQGSALFVVTLPVYQGGVYTLSGTIDGAPIHATTRIPPQLQVFTPAGDTAYIDPNEECLAVCEIEILLLPSTRALLLNSLTSTGSIFFTDLLEYPLNSGLVANNPAVTEIEFLALGNELAAYQLSDTPISNIEGGFGVFGGATRVRKVVVWE